MNYLVFGSCKFYKNEDMQCFMQLKAYTFFKDGHVQDIEQLLFCQGQNNTIKENWSSVQHLDIYG